jgi:hypothetical protein
VSPSIKQGYVRPFVRPLSYPALRKSPILLAASSCIVGMRWL